MAPSGETFLARDRRGQVWLYQPVGAGEPRVVDEALTQRAIADHGFDRVDQEFETWQALDAYRRAHAVPLGPNVQLDRDDLDRENVERFLGVAQRWVAGGEARRARKLVLRLLRLPVVRGDAEVQERLLALLDEFEEPPVRVEPAQLDPLKRAARERWERLAA